MVYRVVSVSVGGIGSSFLFQDYVAKLEEDHTSRRFSASRTVFVLESTVPDASGLFVRSPRGLAAPDRVQLSLQGSYIRLMLWSGSTSTRRKKKRLSEADLRQQFPDRNISLGSFCVHDWW